MLITEKVKINISSSNIRHIKKLGYDVKPKAKIIIPVEHLSKGSHQKVKCKCDMCGKEKELKYRMYLKNTKNHTVEYTCCEKCAHKAGKYKKTLLERYDDENYSNREQAKETWKNKSQKELDIKNYKRKQTLLYKYGNENYSNRDKAIETHNSKSNEEKEQIKKKRVKTNLEKFGVKNAQQNKKVREKTEKTCLEIYGVEHPMQVEEISNKAFETRYRITHEEYLEQLPDFIRYRKEVLEITKKQPLNTLKNYNKRGKYNYHIDHRFSVKEGFLNNICPYIIGNIINLEMLPYKDNISKHSKCSISKEELFERFDSGDKIFK